MRERERLAFLRMMMSGAVNDVKGQLAAFRDLGALPEDADLDELMQVLKLDGPTIDPTKISGEQLVAEIQQILKALLAHGAKLPKNLMLYVKDLLFIDSAIATLAPDLNLFAEVGRIYGYFAEHHGEQILREIGFDPRGADVELDGIRRSLGVADEVETMTHRELQRRREDVQQLLEDAGGIPSRLR